MDYQSDCQLQPTNRFSDRVENYIKYRPGYPQQVIRELQDKCGLSSHHIVADIGSGTGILSELFLKNGNVVFGVEPNTEMRQAGERLLSKYITFKSINGTAEETTLKPQSVDFITAGQAFHWFDLQKARQEFLRLLKPNGCVILIWNDRKTESSPFMRAYEQLLKNYNIDYKKVDHKNLDESVFQSFFKPYGFELKIFDNEQVFDFAGLEGRLLSSSYAPTQGHPKFEPMMNELRKIFVNFSEDGKVRFEYDTRLYYGKLA